MCSPVTADVGGDESWKPILHPDDATLREAWYHAVRNGEPFEMEYRICDHRTGEYRWHLGRALPIKTMTGRVERWFGTCTDIHEQKESLRALEAQAAALRASDRRKDEFSRGPGSRNSQSTGIDCQRCGAAAHQ